MCQRLKDEVRGRVDGQVICIFIIPAVSFIDLHAELTRQNRKKNQTVVGPSSHVVSGDSLGAEPEGSSHAVAPSSQPVQQDHSSAAVPMETSTLIKANPSPQGTPMHTTFAGTQRFTPSTRISALNMVGDLLRKVGVSSSCSMFHHIMVYQFLEYCDRHWSPG